MAHNIFGDRFIGKRQPAWHKLGQTFEEPITAVEAITRAGIDFEIVKMPLTYEGWGQRRAIPQVALVRQPTTDDPDPHCIGVVSESYEFLQNRELAALIDQTVGQHLPVETAGALGKGETFFLTLDAGESEIVPTERVHNYFLVTDNRSGGQSLQIAYTPVRVVCQNTLTSGLSAATVKWGISHLAGHRAQIEADARILGAIHAAQGKITETMRQMATTKVSAETVTTILETVYVEPKMPQIVQRVQSLKDFGVELDTVAAQSLDKRIKDAMGERNRIATFRAGARTLYDKFNDEFPRVAGTGWAIYNAIVETEDFKNGFWGVEESLLWGERAGRKSTAFKATIAAIS